ncbi:MAG: hypothetical protein JW969_07480 [Spirochaetales bacterium]|nr:hypothetical protein [Spirochaetales bacterium]
MKFWIIILSFTVFFSSCITTPETAQKANSSIPFPESRSFKMTVCPIFVLSDIEDRFKALIKELPSVSDVYFNQSDIIWDFEKGRDIDSALYTINFTNFLNMTKALELKTGYIGISVLNDARGGMRDNPFSQSFADERVREACKNMVLRVVKDFHPRYLCFGVEISSYSHKNPDDFKNFVSLYNDVYTVVKESSDEIIMFPTFHYEEFLGVLPWNKHRPDWNLIKDFKTDAFAITTYPYMAYSMDEIPEDYYMQIMGHTDLPLIIAESGFATVCCGEAVKDLHGSEQAQVDYLAFLLGSLNRMEPLLWVYWSLYDYEPLSWGGTDKNDVFNSIGLRYPDGKEKPAYALWKKILNLPFVE